MKERFSRGLLAVLLLALAAALTPATARGAIAPPWCGTAEPDAAASLPDGSQPTDPVGSFPHIPYYAIGCTLQAIAAERRPHDGRDDRPVRAGPSAVRRDDQCPRHTRAEEGLQALAEAPQARARRAGEGAEGARALPGRLQDPDLHPGRDSRERVRGRRRHVAAPQPDRDDAVRHRPAGRRDPRPRDPGREHRPEPGRPGPRAA